MSIIEQAMNDLKAHFPKEDFSKRPELVVEYCKAVAIGGLGYKLIEAADDINTFHNTEYKLNEKLSYIGDQLGRLAEAVESHA